LSGNVKLTTEALQTLFTADRIEHQKEINDNLKTIGTNKTYFIKTYGCQMNEHDSENIKAILEDLGFCEIDVKFSSEIDENSIIKFPVGSIFKNDIKSDNEEVTLLFVPK
jgi:hypothetical protein